MRLSILFVSATLTASLALAKAPSLMKLEPWGGQRGTAVKLWLNGTGIDEQAEIVSTIPGTVTPLSIPKTGPERKKGRPYLLELPADAAVGAYPVYVEGPEGISNSVLFTVGAFPEIVEGEGELGVAGPADLNPYAEYNTAGAPLHRPGNDSLESAEEVTVPLTVNGTLFGPDRDYFRFQASQGDRLVIEAEARRIGSAIDPSIEVFDADGELLGRNNDAPGIGVDSRLDLTFPESGDYYVKIQDARFSRQSATYYRLKIADFTYADGLYPLGGRRGEEIDVEFFGGNLGSPVTSKIKLETRNPLANFMFVRVPGKPGALPLRISLSDDQEAYVESAAGATSMTPGTIYNGRIAEPGQVDEYRLAVKPGQHWFLELEAAISGASDLLGNLTVLDEDGEEITSTRQAGLRRKTSQVDVAVNMDHLLDFEVPEGVQEVAIRVDDLMGKGGPSHSYRFKAEPEPGFELWIRSPAVAVPLRGTALVEVAAVRKGYRGPVKVVIPNAPADLIVEGGHMPQLDEDDSTSMFGSNALLTLSPRPGAEPQSLNLEVWGEAVINGKKVRRRARAAEVQTYVQGEVENLRLAIGLDTNVAPWQGQDLLAKIVKPEPFALEVHLARYQRLIQGEKLEIPWSWVAREKGTPSPKPFDRGNTIITRNVRVSTRGEQEKGETDKGAISFGTQVGWGPGKFEAVVTAIVEAGGETRRVIAPAITMDIVRAYEIEPLTEVTVLAPGEESEFAAKLRREPGFDYPVEVRAENLPFGVSCETATVPGESEEVRLACTTGSSVQPGEYDIDLASSSKVKGDKDKEIPFTLPPFKAKLRIEGDTLAAK